MTTRCLVRQVQNLCLSNQRRAFQTSILRLASNSVHIKDDAEFQKRVLDSKKPTVVDFYATWCGPCKVLEPRLEKVVNNFNKTGSNNTPIQLVKVDIDNLSETTGKYNVQAVPTVVVIKDGREISRFTGAADENRIQKLLEQLSH